MKTLATFTADGEVTIDEGLNGNYAISMMAADGSAASFGGGTIQFTFQDEDGNDLTANTTDFSFTSAPEYPQAWGFPANQPFKVGMTGSTTPDVVVKVAKCYG